MTRLAKIQRAALAVALVAALLGILTATGCRVSEPPDPGWAWLFHALLAALGIGAGIATTLRGIEVDRERWDVLSEELLTKGEREYAHKHAERQHRTASTIFLLAPVALGFFLANYFHQEGTHLLTDSLTVTPLFTFCIGYFAGRRLEDRQKRPDF